jgi:hypothetical protein
VKRSNAMRDYPGLLDEMNRPFRAKGLGVPWYTVFGNHDALIQGNLPGQPFFSSVATGCVKVTDLSRHAWDQIGPLVRGGVTDEENNQIIGIIYGDFLATISSPNTHRGLWKRVAGDPNRRLLYNKPDYIREHMRTRGLPVGHGFTDANIQSGEGNYAFSPKPGLRFVALDTVAAQGPDGNLDDAQFVWLHAQLLAAEAARALVFVFAHHSLASMRQRESGTHYGLTGSCPTRNPAIPPAPDETLLCLFQRHRSVIGSSPATATATGSRRTGDQGAAGSGKSSPPRTRTGPSSRASSTSTTTETGPSSWRRTSSSTRGRPDRASGSGAAAASSRPPR